MTKGSERCEKEVADVIIELVEMKIERADHDGMRRI